MSGTLGVLVAGGQGSRLGLGIPKALAPFAGATLLAHALATLRAVSDDVVVCAPRSLSLPVPENLRVFDAEVAEVAEVAGVAERSAGPLAGLVAGLSSRPFARALVLGVDLPLVDPGLLRSLGERLAGYAAVVPSPGGREQPLAAWYAPSALAPLAAALARGERALVPAVLALSPLLLDDAALAALGAGPDAFLNVNTLAELASAERAVSRGAGA